MKKDIKLLGYYNYTVILTYIGMLFGFCGILKVYSSDPRNAVYSLMAAGFCDMFDGAVARTRERTTQEKCFGIQIDSLSDLICFGVLPAFLAYSLCSTLWAACLCGLYVLCALIRLAYYNVDEMERQNRESSARIIYKGMPVTMAALIIPIVYGAAMHLALPAGIVLTGTLAIMALLFLIPFQLRKPKTVGKAILLAIGAAAILLVIFAKK